VWDSPIMSGEVKAANVDDRRRIVLPENFPAGSAVTYQPLDDDTLIVKRQHSAKVIMVAFERITELPDDPAWEKTEAAFARHAFKETPPFEE